jgi:chromosome segregation ATPase
MGDSGEGLVDAEARIQERLEEIEAARAKTGARDTRDPTVMRQIESLRLARVELERQLERTTHDARRAQIARAIDDLTRQMADAAKRL